MELDLATDWAFNLQLLGPFIISLACGGMVGAERAMNGRPAGIRTYALICFASAMLMAMCAHPDLWANVSGTRGVDPGRVVQGIVAGMGFLGAGVIVRQGFNVKGLTTASAMWVVAAIGVLVGSSLYLAAAIATLLTLVVLRATPTLERVIPKSRYTQASIEADVTVLSEEQLQDMLLEAGFTVVETSYEFSKRDRSQCFRFTFVVKAAKPNAERALAECLAVHVGVVRFTLSPTKDS